MIRQFPPDGEIHDLIVILPEGTSGHYRINEEMLEESGGTLDPLAEALDARAQAMGKVWDMDVDVKESIKTGELIADWRIFDSRR